MGRAGAVVWITGLSGTGKSTVAAELSGLLKRDGRPPVLLDGDQLREALGVTGYDDATRRQLGLTYARLSRLLAAQGHVVVCAVIALYREVHEWNRRNLPNYVEVLLEVPLVELRRRDPKGIYRGSPGGDGVVGLGLAAQAPAEPDLVIGNFGDTTAASAAASIHRLLLARAAA